LKGGGMLRFFVAGNLWLFAAFYCFIERLHGRLSTDAMTLPVIFAFIFFVLYWLTSPEIPLRFSVRSLLLATAWIAIALGILLVLIRF
jgi:hypothetical protein